MRNSFITKTPNDKSSNNKQAKGKTQNDKFAKKKLSKEKLPKKKHPAGTNADKAITKKDEMDICLTNEQQQMISHLPKIVLDVSKLSYKHLRELKKNLFLLFEQLTSKRQERKLNYLNYDSSLVAYSYYYLPWNCLKLVKLFSTIPTSVFLNSTMDSDYVFEFVDFGAGPLTVLIALWIAKPELRNLKIHWSCSDISQKALELGEKIFNALCEVSKENYSAWQIKKHKIHFGEKLNTKFDFYFSSNMFNEFLDINSANFTKEAFKATKVIQSCLKEKASGLIIEPGTPQGASVIRALRLNLMDAGYHILAPCIHTKDCPLIYSKVNTSESKTFSKTNFSYAKRKWCHFVLSGTDAPKSLQEISDELKLPKETIAFSYIFFTSKDNENISKTKKLLARIISDSIELKEEKLGKYACCEYGFILLRSSKKSLAKIKFGDVVLIQKPKLENAIDKKTGARIIEV